MGDSPFRASSPFGYRTHPITGEYTLHNGPDYAAGEGTTVHAAAAGTVTKAASTSISGNHLKIDHGDGYETSYLHLSAFQVGVGDQVQAGQPIGLVGSTGRVTGPHLHFILRSNGTAIDPEPYITREFSSYVVNYWWVAVIALSAVWGAVLYRRRRRLRG